MKTKPSKAEHKRDRLPQFRKGEGEPIHIFLPDGPLADAVEDIDLPNPGSIRRRLVWHNTDLNSERRLKNGA